MTRLRAWLFRAAALVRGRRWAAEKREELQLHLDLEIEAGLRAGLSADEARRRARLRAGTVADAVEAAREEIGFRILDGAALDLRHAARALRRSRGYGAVAVLVLGASVAITTVIFCLLQNVVLRPLPYAEPDRLVRVFDDDGTHFRKFPPSIAHFLAMRAQARSLGSIALYTGRDVELTAMQGASQRLTGVAVTSDFFTVLGRPPFLGRGFSEAELREAARSVVISHRLWQERFRGDPDVVGKTVRLDREPWTIVGVAAPGLQHVGGEYRSPLQGETVDVWLPLALDIPERGQRNWHYTNAVARLAAGATEAQAAQELAAVATHYKQEFGGNWMLRSYPLLREVTGRSRELVWLLVGAGLLVLLLACANIAGLSVARAVARGRELALRQALGANRWQLVRVGLAENLIVGCVGAVLGVGLAAAGVPVLRRLLPADFPRAHEVAFTPTAALFAAAIAVATALVAGLLPIGRRRAASTEPRVTSDRETRRLRSALVVGELALAGLLAAGCLFLLRSFQQINARDHGFQPAGALTFQLTIPGDDRKAMPRIQDEILEKIRAVPGVAAAGAGTNLPWSGYDENTSFGIVGGAADEDDGPNARYQAATPGFVEALGMRLVAGRVLDRARDGDGQPFVVMVNDALAHKYFPGTDAVGRVLDLWGEKRQIVGVVAGVADSPAAPEVKPAFWFSMAQQPYPAVWVTVRAAPGVDPASLTTAVAAAVHTVDRDLPLADVRTLERRAAAALAARRLALSLLESFAALALVLSAAGVYALLAYLVQQRRKELGIRAALGATRADLGRLVLGDGLRMAVGGALVSLLFIPVAGWLMQAFLYRVRPLDALTVAGAPAALLVAALLASLGPARAATKGDPAVVLRED